MNLNGLRLVLIRLSWKFSILANGILHYYNAYTNLITLLYAENEKSLIFIFYLIWIMIFSTKETLKNNNGTPGWMTPYRKIVYLFILFYIASFHWVLISACHWRGWHLASVTSIQQLHLQGTVREIVILLCNTLNLSRIIYIQIVTGIHHFIMLTTSLSWCVMSL